MTSLISLINAAVVFGTVILFGASGEILTEKSGSLNLGVPGIMYIGGMAGLMGAFYYETSSAEPIGFVGMLIALLCCLAASALAGGLYAFLTVSLRANQNVTGLTLTIFGGGFANFFGGQLNKMAGGVGQVRVAATSGAFRAQLPLLPKLGVVGEALFSYGWLVYVAVIIALLMGRFISKTRAGLNLRAVGESPATADAAGVGVTKYRYLSAVVGACVTGLGGLFFVMDYTKGTWSSDGGLEQLGWLAVALVIFARWKPTHAIWGSYLFGVLYWMYLYIPGLTRSSMELFKMLPYVVTIIVLVAVSLKKSRNNEPPASLGLPYFREER